MMISNPRIRFGTHICRDGDRGAKVMASSLAPFVVSQELKFL